MDEQQQIPQQPVQPPSGQQGGGQERKNPWDILFRVVKHTWPVAVIWIAAFFIQNAIIRTTGLKDIPQISFYYKVVLLIEATLLFKLFERLLPKEWWK